MRTCRSSTAVAKTSSRWSTLVHSIIALLASGYSAYRIARTQSRKRLETTFCFCLSCCQSETRLAVGLFELITIFTHVVPDLLNLLEILWPLCHAVCRLLLLETSQNSLVFNSNLHEVFFSLNSVQTGLRNTNWIVELRLWILHNIWHFLQQDSVLSFNLGISACQTKSQTYLKSSTYAQGLSLFWRCAL